MVKKPSKAAGELVEEAVPGRHGRCITAYLRMDDMDMDSASQTQQKYWP